MQFKGLPALGGTTTHSSSCVPRRGCSGSGLTSRKTGRLPRLFGGISRSSKKLSSGRIQLVNTGSDVEEDEKTAKAVLKDQQEFKEVVFWENTTVQHQVGRLEMGRLPRLFWRISRSFTTRSGGSSTLGLTSRRTGRL